ncbi:methyltransferase domain-containing protein [Shewanella sp. AS1]|uniref:methyltransferase domain-containing protein n=1 Tax=Shewanella sp. AS1 TaxID=2907626 RepID=UPI001F20D659|nr:methyltransferase domain-containing protein [Shewanella sp. AS1]MCE9677919.1 methyltransferase domain-containing protein [Shewanella sp. AS1]
MKSHYLCPKCHSPMSVHQESQGLYCANKHHLDKSPNGYWVFSQAKKPQLDSRQLMRAKRFLLESGIFAPLTQALSNTVTPLLIELSESAAASIKHLDFDCGDGFFLRALAPTLKQASEDSTQTGVAEAENALFSAAKVYPDATYILSQLKQLPFADESFDLVTLIDKPLKGKELLRVLKPGGLLVQVSAAPRHQWQIKTFVYGEMSEKEGDLSLPKQQKLLSRQRISFELDVTSEQALTLAEMSPFAWRVTDKVRRQMLTGDFHRLECDFYLTVSVKQAI